MQLTVFNEKYFLPELKALFKDLKAPMNQVTDEPNSAKEILKDTYKVNDTFQHMDDIYFVEMVYDTAFNGNKSPEVNKIKSDYGILIFGVTIKADQRTALYLYVISKNFKAYGREHNNGLISYSLGRQFIKPVELE